MTRLRAGAEDKRLATLLLRSVRGIGRPPDAGTVGSLRRVDPSRFVAAADHHRVASALYVDFHRAGVDAPDLVSQLGAVHRWQMIRQLHITADLRKLAALLDGAIRRWAVVKGPVLAQAVYDRPDLRTYHDLDVLVHGAELPAALAALEAAGATLVDRNWRMMLEQRRGELTVRLPGATSLDLHWHLINNASTRAAFHLSIPEMLARRERRAVSGIELPVLDLPDMVLHLAVHASLNGGHRLLWFLDLSRAAALMTPSDWQRLAERSRRYGVHLVVAAMLARTGRLFPGTVPPEVLDRLAGRAGWRSVIALADRLAPAELSHTGRFSGRAVVRATRTGTVASSRELVRQLRRRSSRETQPPGANPLWTPTDHGARDQYLRSVATEAAAPT